MSSRPASLDALPNELLYQILRYLTKEREAIPRRYQMATVFTSINRRLRQFALPHSFKELGVPNHNRLPAMFEAFKSQLSRIKSLRVGHSPSMHTLQPRGWDPSRDKRFLPAASQFARLENLVNFHCAGFCFEPRQLQVFGRNSGLQSLRLEWDSGYLFPFEAFPSLENLSLQVIARYKMPISYHKLRVFLSLTSLSIIDTVMWFDTMVCGRAIFPSLRVFHLLPHSPDCCVRILGFISDHPTLLEVNIPRMYVSFSDFINLAKGEREATWHTLPSKEAFRVGTPAPYDPDFYRWNGVQIAGFSFVRAIRLQPEDPADPIPLHKLTELSIRTSPNGDALRLEGIGALGEVPLLADCTRLSLVISDSNSDEDPDMEDIRSIMTVLGDSLARWRSLRYLFLGCTYPDHYGSLPMRKGKPLDCKTYFEDAESVSLDWAEELRQEAIDFHGLESHGDACAMELWKELHEYEEMWVGRLAWACTTLEVIEWSMQERGFDADGLSLGRCPHPPLWRWKVHREPDGAARLVSGQLTWNGHPNHPPPVG